VDISSAKVKIDPEKCLQVWGNATIRTSSVKTFDACAYSES
jgi:hypothetical protein